MDNIENIQIALSAERNLTSQTELILTLSLAIIGGIMALIIRIQLHNVGKESTKIGLRRIPLLWLAIFCAAAAILFGYLVTGSLIEMAPQIFSHGFDFLKPFSSQDFNPASISFVKCLSFAQFSSFFSAVISVIFFAIGNITR